MDRIIGYEHMNCTELVPRTIILLAFMMTITTKWEISYVKTTVTNHSHVLISFDTKQRQQLMQF
jgi:hypothetical protein